MMQTGRFKYWIFLICIVYSDAILFSRDENIIKYVNPFIGTARTKTKSFWGSEGGTYPGAVSPFGFIQLSPETNVTSAKGYNYVDSTIFLFSCINHMSGYPNGSSGNIYIMPVETEHDIEIGRYCRPFHHRDEKAEPGYYSVLFRDNGTIVEATSSERTGMFRFTFPRGITPAIYFGDIGKIEIISKRFIHGSQNNVVFHLSKDFTEKRDVGQGTILTFTPDKNKNTELILTIGVSSSGFESSEANIKDEAGKASFSEFREQNQRKWIEALSVIDVEDPSADNKSIFYTALYHSLLLPWIISDVNGNYRGADRKIHKTSGKNQYGAFSPWDTFRSLHPLLCLVAPERQKDMILSALDQFIQTGRLPGGPMTGNHITAIIADSWMKGIKDYDSALALKAMKSTLDSASRRADMAAYLRLGYVPSSFAESVTRTVEYAYDDWIVSQFAAVAAGDYGESGDFIKRSYNYRNLFDRESLFILPRMGNSFIQEPGYYGYKEGDKWSYSLFVPHNPVDLINISGGKTEFAVRLDSALANDLILFDNEPVLHVPYLFNYACKPSETQKWVRSIMKSHYKNSPDGLPGNDDLGAMSSWYVFSALGVFPLCPGRPVYDFGSPLFEKAVLHLADNKVLMIKSENNGNENYYVNRIQINGIGYEKSWISHTELTGAAEILFRMDNNPAVSLPETQPVNAVSSSKTYSDFRIHDFRLPGKKVKSGEQFWITFSLSNSGSYGAYVVKLYADGKEYSHRNIMADSGSVVVDSIKCRLYPIGISKIHIDNLADKDIEVTELSGQALSKFSIKNLECVPAFKAGEYKNYSYTIQNIGGYRDSTDVLIFAGESLIQADHIALGSGEIKKVVHKALFRKPGLYNLKVDSELIRIKIYARNTDAKLVDLKMEGDFQDDTFRDYSGFSNDGFIVKEEKDSSSSPLPFKSGKNSFIELRNSPSLDKMGENITIMAWILPSKDNRGLTDIITKGDFIALQAAWNRTLSFFAGGWGRGSCEARVPENWTDTWHHIAGVSDGYTLKLYIDGLESGRLDVNSPVNLSYTGKWMIGRNEEFPGERFFRGGVRQVKIFGEALTSSEITNEMNAK